MCSCVGNNYLFVQINTSSSNSRRILCVPSTTRKMRAYGSEFFLFPTFTFPKPIHLVLRETMLKYLLFLLFLLFLLSLGRCSMQCKQQHQQPSFLSTSRANFIEGQGDSRSCPHHTKHTCSWSCGSYITIIEALWKNDSILRVQTNCHFQQSIYYLLLFVAFLLFLSPLDVIHLFENRLVCHYINNNSTIYNLIF